MSEVFVSFLPAALAAMEAGARKAAWAAGDVLRNNTVKNLSGARTGRQYKVPDTQVYYTASSPGEYPAVATGNLRENVKIKIVKDGVQVGTPVEYGLALEKKSASEGGRPWLEPSYKESKREMEAKMRERWF